MDDILILQLGEWRVKFYREGGLGVEQRVPGIGWVTAEDDPPLELVSVVDFVRGSLELAACAGAETLYYPSATVG